MLAADVSEVYKNLSVVLDRLIKPFSQLAELTGVIDRHNKAKGRFLIKTVTGTTWGHSAQPTIAPESFFQRLKNPLYNAMHELGTS